MSKIEGTIIGAITDISGKYTFDLPNTNATLVFSFIGYESQSIIVGNQSTINVALIPSTLSLDEVIVIGYGTQKKSDLTGSVSRVTMSDIKTSLANVNLAQALAGASPGLNVEGSGGAGGEPSLSIRGQTSLSASGEPLIVLDGIIYNGSLNSINMYDVESR